MILSAILALSIFGATSPAAPTESWQCRNDLEIRCDAGKCAAETRDAFTPMSVSFDDSGKISVCAYTGCWEGTGTASETGTFLMLMGENFKFSTSDTSDMNEDVAIILDKKDKIAVLKAGGFAHPLICEKGVQDAGTPTFEQHKVAVSSAKPKPIIFAGNRDARMFRTRLGDALKGGVNFAGHFVFATWGCGTSCLQGALIDTNTGVVHFPEELRVMSFGFIDDGEQPLQYHNDSKLFILRGTVGEGEDSVEGVHYLVWEGTKFKQLKFVPSER